MPAERISKSFKDISMSFKINPINYDLIAIKNETAIARSIRNLILTSSGERFFQQSLGSGVQKYLFENVDEITSSVLEDTIRNVIDLYEPRVKLNTAKVVPNYDSYEFEVTLEYEIIGIDLRQQQLAFALQPSR